MSMKLVIAFGNPLRGDDAVGWHAAAALESLGSDACVLVRQQLAPELAVELARAEVVVFLDAQTGGEPGRISVASLQPASSLQPLSHACNPVQLLGIALALYGKCPRATLLTVNGSRFEFADRLSGPVQKAVARLVRETRALLSSGNRMQAGDGRESDASPIGLVKRF